MDKMGWQKLRQKARDLCCTCTARTTLKVLFQVTTISILGLLLPLSFLPIARLSSAHFPFILPSQPIPSQASSHAFLRFRDYYTNPTLYVLVSIISFAALIQSLACKIITTNPPLVKPCLFLAWTFLCTLQLCVGVGIEGSISAGVDKFTLGMVKKSLLSKMIFFLGLHETMLYWCRAVVKPIADEAIFGGVGREERWMERVAMAMSFGFVWWWRLRDEVEAMVIVGDVKKQLSMNLEYVDLLNWWLYYLTVTIGIVRVVKAAMWLSSIFLCTSDHMNYGDDNTEPHDKV